MDFFTIALGTAVGLLPIANPFSTAALFLGITRGDSPERRRRQAFLGCVYMFGILAVFLVLGTAIMEFFGISIPGLRIAGGLMVTRVAMSMLRPDDDTPEEAAAEAREKADVSFTPLAMPSLSGPGAIAVTIGMASEAERFVDYGAILLGILAVATLCWIALRASTSVVRVLGQTGLDAVSRIMGFLLLCVGVQFIVNGIIEIATREDLIARVVEGVRAVAE